MLEYRGCDYPHDHTRLLLHDRLQYPKSEGQNQTGILHNPSPMGQPVVEYPVIDFYASAEESHQLGLEGGGIIADEEVLNLEPVAHK